MFSRVCTFTLYLCLNLHILQVAVSRDVPVMRAAWVDRVWDASRQQTVAATDAQFADLTCPPLQGLYVCVSQISRRDKEAIRRLIESNGKPTWKL